MIDNKEKNILKWFNVYNTNKDIKEMVDKHLNSKKSNMSIISYYTECILETGMFPDQLGWDDRQ